MSAICSLGHPDGAVLLAVYALAPDVEHAPNLQSCRDAHGQARYIRRQALADREARAGRWLIQMATVWCLKSPLPLRVPESRNAIVSPSIHTLTAVENRRHTGTRRRIRLLATFDGAVYRVITRRSEGPSFAGDGTARAAFMTRAVGSGWTCMGPVQRDFWRESTKMPTQPASPRRHNEH